MGSFEVIQSLCSHTLSTQISRAVLKIILIVAVQHQQGDV